MPFTPAHPAIVLPLLKCRHLSATGLIVGSVSPDFEYFLKASVSGVHEHTLLGIFYFDLPVSVMVALVFHWLIKESFIQNLPQYFQIRLLALCSLNFKQYISMHYLGFISSVLLGTASHIFWDSFTHNGRYFVKAIPLLTSTHIELNGAKYPLWYALQHASTAVGLTIILIYFLRAEPTSEYGFHKPKLGYWLALVILTVGLFYLRFSLFTIRYDIGNVVVTLMSALMVSFCLLGLYFKLRLKNKP